MSFAKRLEELDPTRGRSTCLTCSILVDLSPADRDAVNAALHDPIITHADLWRIFQAEGYTLTVSSIRRHRVRECRGS